MKGKVLRVAGMNVSTHVANTVIVGAGAAGMACAVQLARFWRQRGVSRPQERLLVVTAALGGGASRMSGSDKQTYYKMGTSPGTPDSAEDFARTLTAFGCCHGDTALVEGLLSLPAFYHLVQCGVPFPHDARGAFVGYKTDHDPYQRATSAGPKTSRFMSECLQAEARRMGVPIVDKQLVVDFLTARHGKCRRIRGLACLDLSARKAGVNLSLFLADNWVLAAGGPGELYAATVYPRGQSGIHAAAFRAGLEARNLTESQFGLASIRFRWNVSGTYMQVVPRIFSTDADGGDPREFLTEYFQDMPTLATNIFLKGYQWPFDAQRIAPSREQCRTTGRQSSLIDMAVHQETVVRGRRVWMDFLRNPIGRPGWAPFDIRRLGSPALEYLSKTGALQATPIARLGHMNRPAIDIYAEHGIDLTSEPLEIALCAQHNNGGFAVNAWWESNVPRVFVIGEMAGTHGVKRPGGSALNAGQVGAMRAAEYISAVYGADTPGVSAAKAAVRPELARVLTELKDLLAKGKTADVTPPRAMHEIGQRMTRFGAHLRWQAGARQALQDAVEQYRRLRREGLKLSGPRGLPAAIRAMQQCLTHIAMLKAICGMLQRGAGSRGSHCVLDETGIGMHSALIDPGTNRPYRFRPENEALRDHILCVRYDPDLPELFRLRDDAPRPIPHGDAAFELAWAEYRQGAIYRA